MKEGKRMQGSMGWLVFALMTVAAWGTYGIFLHIGQTAMADPINGRYKAFLFVGIAYFLTAVLAPIAVLLLNKADWRMPAGGMTWSLIAGIVGAVGAFCVLLAFGARGTPAVVMSIIFGGAPVVNALVAMAMHPPPGGLSDIRWQFWLGLVLAATGGALVMLFRPPAGPAQHASPPAAVSPAQHGDAGGGRTG